MIKTVISTAQSITLCKGQCSVQYWQQWKAITRNWSISVTIAWTLSDHYATLGKPDSARLLICCFVLDFLVFSCVGECVQAIGTQVQWCKLNIQLWNQNQHQISPILTLSFYHCLTCCFKFRDLLVQPSVKKYAVRPLHWNMPCKRKISIFSWTLCLF